MKRENLIILGLIVLASVLLISKIYASAPIANDYWGKVTLDGAPAEGSVVTAWIGGEERGRDDEIGMVGGEAWYGLAVDGTADDDGETITFRVGSYVVADTSTFDATREEDYILLHLNAYSATAPTGCELGSVNCGACTGWVTATDHSPCGSPEGCVRASGGGDYDWACCGGTIIQISIF